MPLRPGGLQGSAGSGKEPPEQDGGLVLLRRAGSDPEGLVHPSLLPSVG
jgi:hypothetical protein